MRFVPLCFVAVCLVLVNCLPQPVQAADGQPVLERVVMVSRHGVRSPIRPIETLEALTQRRWPKWPVGPGEMTEHGALSLTRMADFLREVYRDKGLLPTRGCSSPGTLEVWSDAADLRTRQSGEIFAARLAPACGIAARHASGLARDALFNASGTQACPVAPPSATTARPKESNLRPEDLHALQTLQNILAPDACRAGGAGVCLIPDTAAPDAKVAAKLAVAATLAEGLYLEYAQGFPSDQVGWGKAGSEATIATIMPAYERGIDFMRRNPIISARRGVLLVDTILRLLQGRKLPADAPALSNDAKLVMIAGHDSNLLQSAVLMGLDWRLPDQPSVTAPDTVLAFEVWRDLATNRRTLKVVVYAQTLRQIREGTILDRAHPADVMPVVPEACAKDEADGCQLASFVADVDRRLAKLCSK